MRRSFIPLLIFILPFLSLAKSAEAHSKSASLQPGVTIENALAMGESHSFTINLEGRAPFLGTIPSAHLE